MGLGLIARAREAGRHRDELWRAGSALNSQAAITDSINKTQIAQSQFPRRAMTQTPELKSTSSARAARSLAEAPPPSRIGTWELVRPLGQGLLARVYQARPIDSAANVPAGYAIKVLREGWVDDPRGLEIVCREARVGRRVSHRHLVPILAASLHQRPYFLVMPYLQGQNLAELLATKERPALPAALWIARQVAEGLDALHGAGWMHADVKPSNIFVAPTAHVTLIDLGFARRGDEIGSVASRPVVGSLDYIAPEALSSTLRADIRSDIYSLGVTLFEMLSGRLPFDADDVATLAAAHRQSLPCDLRVLEPQIPTRVARLIRQMLAKEPLRRPQTPRELVDRLTALEIDTFAQRAAC
jgi:serine/threonine protein kinase